MKPKLTIGGKTIECERVEVRIDGQLVGQPVAITAPVKPMKVDGRYRVKLRVEQPDRYVYKPCDRCSRLRLVFAGPASKARRVFEQEHGALFESVRYNAECVCGTTKEAPNDDRSASEDGKGSSRGADRASPRRRRGGWSASVAL